MSAFNYKVSPELSNDEHRNKNLHFYLYIFILLKSVEMLENSCRWTISNEVAPGWWKTPLRITRHLKCTNKVILLRSIEKNALQFETTH